MSNPVVSMDLREEQRIAEASKSGYLTLSAYPDPPDIETAGRKEAFRGDTGQGKVGTIFSSKYSIAMLEMSLATVVLRGVNRNLVHKCEMMLDPPTA